MVLEVVLGVVLRLAVDGCGLAQKVWNTITVYKAYSGATGRGPPLPLARGPGVSLGFHCFLLFLYVFPCVFEFLKDFRGCVSLVFGGVSGGFHSLCFSRLFLLTMA